MRVLSEILFVYYKVVILYYQGLYVQIFTLVSELIADALLKN